MISQRVREALRQRGYGINEQAYEVIAACDDWYRAKETSLHRRVSVGGGRYSLLRMGFGRRLAADDANLCEVVEINPGAAGFALCRKILKENGFESNYRRQLELVSAEGTAACYVWVEGASADREGRLQGGRIRLHFVEAGQYAPLTVENGEVTEAAFWGSDLRGTRERSTLVLFTKDAQGRYVCESGVFAPEEEPVWQRVQLGAVKPFAVLRTADVNTIPGMEGFGYPKLQGVIPLLAALDGAFTALMGDIDTAEKITLINEVLCRFDGQGNPIPPNEQMKRRFVLLGEKLPEQSELVHEITPQVRVAQFRDVIELLLSLLTRQYGFGSKKYSLDTGGRLVTATQYVGERLEMLQELNRQRFEARRYIEGLVHAIFWFANAFLGCGLPVDGEVEVEFDDSYITDRSAQLEDMRRDVIDGIGGVHVRQVYLQKRYNLTEEEAVLWAGATQTGETVKREGEA